ncbi:MAG: DMT family transporter [Rhodospirillaceae bacterium]
MDADAAQRRALLLLIVGAVATASNPMFVRLSDLEPGGSAFHRMFWALPLLCLWSTTQIGVPKRERTDATLPRPGDRWLLALCGLFFAGDLTALHWSIELTAVANSILFLNAQPIYVIVGAWLLFGDRLGGKFLVSAVIALAGAVVMVGESAKFGGERLLGDGLGIVAGLCYAGYILTASRLSARYSSPTINLWTCTIGAPLLLCGALVSGQGVVPGSAEGWALAIALGVIAQATGQGFIVTALARLPAGFSAVALLAAPVASALMAWVILAEPLSAAQIGGMAVVLAGIYLAQHTRTQ